MATHLNGQLAGFRSANYALSIDPDKTQAFVRRTNAGALAVADNTVVTVTDFAAAPAAEDDPLGMATSQTNTTILAPGLYLVSASMDLSTFANLVEARIRILIGGVVVKSMSYPGGALTDIDGFHLCAVIRCDAGNVVTMQVFQNSDGAETATATLDLVRIAG